MNAKDCRYINSTIEAKTSPSHVSAWMQSLGMQSSPSSPSSRVILIWVHWALQAPDLSAFGPGRRASSASQPQAESEPYTSSVSSQGQLPQRGLAWILLVKGWLGQHPLYLEQTFLPKAKKWACLTAPCLRFYPYTGLRGPLGVVGRRHSQCPLIFLSQQKKCVPLCPKASAPHFAKGAAGVGALPLALPVLPHSPVRPQPHLSPVAVSSEPDPLHPLLSLPPSLSPSPRRCAPGFCCPGLFLT